MHLRSVSEGHDGSCADVDAAAVGAVIVGHGGVIQCHLSVITGSNAAADAGAPGTAQVAQRHDGVVNAEGAVAPDAAIHAGRASAGSGAVGIVVTAFQGDIFIVDVHVLEVDSLGDLERVAVAGGVDRLLDGAVHAAVAVDAHAGHAELVRAHIVGGRHAALDDRPPLVIEVGAGAARTTVDDRAGDLQVIVGAARGDELRIDIQVARAGVAALDVRAGDGLSSIVNAGGVSPHYRVAQR